MGKQEFQSNVVVANEYTLLGVNSKYGVVDVGTVAKDLFVGAEKLQGRTTLFIQCHLDNSDNVYIGLTSSVTTSNFGILLMPGQSLQLKLSTGDNPMSIYAISGSSGQKVALIEGVN